MGALKWPQADAVHIWWGRLDLPAGLQARALATLSDDERARAERLRIPAARERYRAGRGMLRALLSGYTGASPAALRFGYGPRRKPFLAEPEGASALRFNVSHSADRIVVAVAVDREVGVDLERERPGIAAVALAERYFAQKEAEAIAATPGPQRPAAFARLWTRKEAMVKAAGGTLIAGLRAAPDPRWSVVELAAPPGFAASLVVEGPPARLEVRQWEWSDAGSDRH